MSFFVGREMVMVICFGNVLFSPSSMFVSFLNLLFLCPLIAVSGHVAHVWHGLVAWT